MKFIQLIVVFLIPCISFAQTNFNELVWADEFNTNGAPNPAFWSYDIGASGWGNNEVQNYTSANQNVRVENGSLIIDALKINDVWTSARIKSQGKKNFTYGRIIFRAKLPPGSGTWPALWLLGESVTSQGWPACGEIDVMEHVGKNPGVIMCALHTTSSSGNTQNVGSTTVGTFNTEFNLYEILWTADKIDFKVNGNTFYTYAPAVKNAATWPFNAHFFLIMNIAMGGNLGSDPQYETNGLKNGIDPALTQARMEVDYVRVYQQFTGLQISGSSILQKNQTNVSYSTNNVEGAVYEWSVPADAQILSGQGTNAITVNWGATEGDVNVKVTIGETVYEKSLPIVHPVKPQGSIFQLTTPPFGINWIDQDPVNSYAILEEESATRVNYNVSNPTVAVGIKGNFNRPLDMSDHPVLKACIRTYNKSKTLSMRIDLLDEHGNSTNKTPVFNLFPVIDDGEPYTYSFNYQTQNGWQSTSTTVNAQRITAANFYIDFGVFGKAGEDSIWIEKMWIEDISAPSTINRPSTLSGTITGNTATLTWKDNATNETGFEIHQAEHAAGPYTKITTLPANITQHNIGLGDDDLARYYYRVLSFNNNAVSDFSNAIKPDIITSSENDLVNLLHIYPNPSAGIFTVVHNTIDPIQLQIKSASGKLVNSIFLQPQQASTEVDLTNAPKGPYILEIISRTQTAHKKIFIY
jgi:beta-glucanase (GH16 family)